MATRKTPLTSVSVAIPTRDALNRMAFDMTARTRQRVTLSMLAAALLAVGQEHADEVARALTNDPEGTGAP